VQTDGDFSSKVGLGRPKAGGAIVCLLGMKVNFCPARKIPLLNKNEKRRLAVKALGNKSCRSTFPT